LLYNTQLDPLSSCPANGGVLLVGRPDLRLLREGDKYRYFSLNLTIKYQ
jgi:hypothetical protein